jgi:hypothetical protein
MIHPKAAVREAVEALAAAKKANAATSKINRERVMANAKMVKAVNAMNLSQQAKYAEIRARTLPRLPLPVKTAPDVRRLLIEERHANEVMRQTKPAVWAEKIAQIQECAVRGAVACVVWWDHFSAQLVPNRWDHLDAFMDNGASASNVDDAALEAGLAQVGYTPYGAWSRSIDAKERMVRE